jgi:cyanate permease
MYVFAFLNLIGTFVCIFMLPSELNIRLSDEETAEIEEMMDEEEAEFNAKAKKDRDAKKMTWGKLLSSKEAVFAMLSAFVGTFNVTFWSSWLPTNIGRFGFEEANLGFVIGSQSLTYLVGCLVVVNYFDASPRKFQFFLSILLFGFTMFMMGPSELLGIPQN